MMLYLAECWERSGKIASAWAQFREAQAMATKEKDARVKVAKERADKLDPRLSRLAIVVEPPTSEADDLVVTRNGQVVGRAAWGIEAPVDPGPHVIRVTARDREAFEKTVEVGPNGAKEKIVVPTLAVARAPEATAAPPPPAGPPPADPRGAAPPRDDGSRTTAPAWRTPVTLALGGVGLAGIGVGSFFGLRAMSTLDESDAHCDARGCDQQGVDLANDSRSQANVSTVAFAVGGVAIASAVLLWLFTR